MSKTQERLERRNATMENFTHLKICPRASPGIKCDLIKAHPPRPPYTAIHSRVCEFVHACACLLFRLQSAVTQCFARRVCEAQESSCHSGRRSQGFEEQPAQEPQGRHMSQAFWPPWQLLWSLFILPFWKVFRRLREKYLSPPLSLKVSTCLTVLNFATKVCNGIPSHGVRWQTPTPRKCKEK